MNKKIFAALASATMALSATGSLAVFAEDFDNVDEATPVLPSNPAEEESKVLWNEDNFGDLVNSDTVTFAPTGFAPEVDEEIPTEDLKGVTSITLGADFNGEVKGLNYFTKLETFTSNAKQIENTSLDFSKNTVLETIEINSGASELSDLVLPNPDEDGNYSLTSLTLADSQLTSLDLSEQEVLESITVTGGNLNSIKLYPATPRNKVNYNKLDLSNNSLEEIDLKNYTFENLNLSANHIGVLDLSDTTVTNTPELDDQTFFVAADASTVDLTEYFPSIEMDNVTAGTGAKVVRKDDEPTGEPTGELEITGVPAEYTYATGLNDATLSVSIYKANPMYRLYNPNSGEHFYTRDLEEKDALVTLGWSYEGIGWVAPLDPDQISETDNVPTSDQPGQAVYRLYNPNAGDHHYTKSENEKNILASIGWKYEGIGWYSGGSVDVYREYNPNAKAAGAHNYTTNKAENDFLISVGWLQEGIGWNALQ